MDWSTLSFCCCATRSHSLFSSCCWRPVPPLRQDYWWLPPSSSVNAWPSSSLSADWPALLRIFALCRGGFVHFSPKCLFVSLWFRGPIWGCCCWPSTYGYLFPTSLQFLLRISWRYFCCWTVSPGVTGSTKWGRPCCGCRSRGRTVCACNRQAHRAVGRCPASSFRSPRCESSATPTAWPFPLARPTKSPYLNGRNLPPRRAASPQCGSNLQKLRISVCWWFQKGNPRFV